MAALTVGRHLEFDALGVNILLYPQDTKGGRAESFCLPETLLPYFVRYVNEVRPRLIGSRVHDGLWDARQGSCDLVYAEALDRVSRDQEDAAGFSSEWRPPR